MTVPNRIEKQIVLRSPVDRVWRAVSDAREFGMWFGVAFSEEFAAGARVIGKIRPTVVDPEVAKLQAPHEGKAFDITIERIEPVRLFSFRWHPFAIDPNQDYTREPTTLVEFELSETDEGTRLRITESGFDNIPLARRAEAFAANEGGWEHQTRLIEKYVASRMQEQTLAERRCQPCEGGTAALDDQAVTEMLKRLAGWFRNSGTPGIERAFRFRDYPETLLFATAVGWMAQRENHHPILEIHYNRCIVRYYTHAVGGLSENDFICAAKVSALFEG